MGLGDDLAHSLEAGVATTFEQMHDRGWPIEEQIDAVLAALQIHIAGRSQQVATDRELYILERLIADGLVPERARDYFRRMDPEDQPERETWLFEHRESHKRMREAHREWGEWEERHGNRYPIPQHITDKLQGISS